MAGFETNLTQCGLLSGQNLFIRCFVTLYSTYYLAEFKRNLMGRDFPERSPKGGPFYLNISLTSEGQTAYCPRIFYTVLRDPKHYCFAGFLSKS